VGSGKSFCAFRGSAVKGFSALSFCLFHLFSLSSAMRIGILGSGDVKGARHRVRRPRHEVKVGSRGRAT
jgi:hypothetical protein